MPAAFVSDHLLAITGIGLARGRDFLPEEHKAGGAPAALVTRRFWDRIFGPDVPLNGQVVRLDDRPFAIVGILADPARLPVTTSSVSRDSSTAQVWIPFVHNPFAQVRSVPVMNVMARLKPGITVAQAEAELQSVGRTLHTRDRSRQSARGFRGGHHGRPDLTRFAPDRARAVRGGAVPAADCVRQRGQPSAGSIVGASTGTPGTRGAGRVAWPHHRAAPDGEPALCGGGIAWRAPSCLVVAVIGAGAGHWQSAADG